MKFLRVVNWEHYQHYKNRRAPWIKTYTEIVELPLEHPNFTNLSDGAKLTLHHLRLLAGVTANEIPESALTRDRLNMKTEPRVTELVSSGFVEWDGGASNSASNVASNGASEEGPGGASASLRTPARGRSRGRSQGSQVLDLDSSPREGNGKKVNTGARELVESFAVTDKHREWAADKAPGVDVDAVTDAWRDHFRSRGYHTTAGPIRDADAAWRNWMRNEIKFGRGGAKPASAPKSKFVV